MKYLVLPAQICGLVFLFALTLTFAEYLRLASLAPGRYQAMIEVKDMVTRKSTKQEAAFEIVP